MNDRKAQNLLIWGRLSGRGRVQLENVEVEDPDYTGGSRTLREPTMMATLIIDDGSFYIKSDSGNRRIGITFILPGSFERAVAAYLMHS